MRTDHSPALPNLRVPANWQAQAAPKPGILLLMTPRAVPASGLAPCITLSVAETDLNLVDHQSALRELFQEAFDRVDIEDADIYDYQGAEVSYLRFFHRTDQRDLIVEVWCWVATGRVWSLVASADHRDHPDFCDMFDDVAATFDLSAALLAS